MAHNTLFPAVLGMIRLMYTVIKKKNGIAHCFTTRPLPAKAESGLVATLKVKGYSLWIKHPPACCIEQCPRPLPFMVHTAQHNVLMRPLPARAGSGLLQYNLSNIMLTKNKCHEGSSPGPEEPSWCILYSTEHRTGTP